ncbi:DNA cytosine methyltransferase [Salmonella enterica subsp. enterica serovar Oranienburg]|nr:DNA cytosine methyltransferase [Salmonella enterica]EHQ0666433.1 DNA cytosine methyltransferase [Salmonella enterica subsp. enterica serovar Oranienburg]HDH3765878.1 DNA cytosine methyltransferase [Salmonella enterica subsp. enterica serovar Oranienburg]HDH3807871.1 DNA cytosine methyltransferase [Salmonella enterica subsp. enterica serovar Oranienburg]HDH3817989.1 DNA cytosine methyltransferase [Salmonella enterica subsp. enterica serovar Oranienburg]HDH3824484.1 DNA cytosine methyltransfe
MTALTYGSVCSGIEAASVAWEGLGWRPAWFAEIEPFPSAVLAHHWPEVVNLGDMTKIASGIRAGLIEAPHVLVGGTPCQAFSIAGLRIGLEDARGQLTLAFVDLVNAIDEKRREQEKSPVIVVWENVPGVLSSNDNAFGYFLAGLAGESCALESPGRKWTNAGYVLGPERSVAWRVLDAQFFGVAQRRRRVFVVASARAGIDPAKILFESEGVRRDIAPRREPQTTVAALTARGVGTCGADDNQAQAGHLIAFGGGNCSGAIDVAACLTAKGQRIDFDVETFAVHGTQDPDTNHELAHTLGRNQGQENAVYSVALRGRTGGMSAELGDQVSCALRASGSGKAYLLNNLRVRRLTPRECERLQGFPDDHTLIPYGRFIRPEKMDRDYAKYLMRGGQFSFDYCCRAAADGPRYKAIGNSMAVPVMRWIGKRISDALEQTI